MIHCSNCQTLLPENARFCTNCGDANPVAVEVCKHCQQFSPPFAKRCYHCHTPLAPVSISISEAPFPFNLDEIDTLEEQIETQFYKKMRLWVSSFIDEALYDRFVEATYEPTFRKNFRKAVVLEADRIFEATQKPAIGTNQAQTYQIDPFIDHWWLQLLLGPAGVLCPELLSPQLSVLPTPTKVNHEFDNFVYAYLQHPSHSHLLVREPDSALIISAKERFFNTLPGDKVILAIDFSINRNFREGLIISRYGWQWRMPLSKPEHIWHHEISDIRRERNWLLINGIALDAGGSLNFKISLLLLRLRTIFALQA